MRVPATHACPLFINPARITSGIACARSTSSSRIVGDLPPNSSVTRLKLSAALRRIALPVFVEPVNEIFATSGWRLRVSPTVSPRPVTMLNTPGGSAASRSASVTICVCRALISLGLMTAVQPAASAAASLPQINPASLFHGVISPATPSGVICTVAAPAEVTNSNASSASMA